MITTVLGSDKVTVRNALTEFLKGTAEVHIRDDSIDGPPPTPSGIKNGQIIVSEMSVVNYASHLDTSPDKLEIIRLTVIQ